MPKPKSGSDPKAAAAVAAPSALAINGGEDDGAPETTAAVLSGFSDTIAALRSAPPPVAQAVPRNEDSIADVVGSLKIMHSSVAALQPSPTPKSMRLACDMAALAMAYLPEDTRDALRKSECGSDVAMELVARNLTQLPALAKKLYKVGCTRRRLCPPRPTKPRLLGLAVIWRSRVLENSATDRIVSEIIGRADLAAARPLWSEIREGLVA